jgi:LysR family hydrogen peroxide-inducible transcriptional activator
MNIQQFKYVLAVEEHKHFEVAAERSHITQSTLSTMISKFEDELGLKIFDRKKKPVQLTNEGAVIVEQLKVIINQIEQLKEITKEVKGEVTGTLSLSVIPTLAPFLLPLFLQDFASKFPNLNIKVREEPTSEIVRKLKSRELDIGLLSIPLNDNEIIEHKLFDEPFLFFDAKAITPKNISANKIKVENLCLMEEGHCLRTQVLRLCEVNTFPTNNTLNFEYKAGSIDSLLRFVKANQASTLLPFLATQEFTAQEKTHISAFKAPIPYRTIGLVVHRHFVKKKLLEALQQEIIQKISRIIQPLEIEGEMLLPIE